MADFTPQGMMPVPEGVGFAYEAGMMPPSLPGFGQFSSWQDFQKAITTGAPPYTTDVVGFTGGRALMRQSLEASLIAILQTQQDFKLFNRLNKSQANNIVDEFTVVDDTGMWPGAAVNTELGDIVESTGSYKRFVLQIKYLMDRRRVSVLQDMVPAQLASATTTEQMLSTLGLLTSCEWLLFNGDAAIIPEEYNGIFQIVNSLYPEHVIDARGASIDPYASEIIGASEQIAGVGTYGVASDVYWSNAIQADVDQGLNPAVRWSHQNMPAGGMIIGAPVTGIRSSFAHNGRVDCNPDKFIQEGGKIFSLRYPNASMGTNAPAAPTITVQPATSGANSKWAAEDIGAYLWAVEAINKSGRSAVVVSSGLTLTSADIGKNVTIGITSAAETGDKAATGYVIYRTPIDQSKDIGGVTNANFRETERIAVSAVGSSVLTTYTDDNSDLPGTSKAYVLNLAPGMEALDIRRLAPLTRFNLYPTSRLEIPWAQFLFLALRSMKPRQHYVIKNLCPRTAAWKPRG